MLAKMTRYKVFVLNLKPKRAFPVPADDEVFLQERDVFFGYSYKHHRSGKYFDLWFSNPKEKDPQNFVTLGRILRIEDVGTEEHPGKFQVLTTKLGRFYVEAYETEVVQGKGAEGRERGKGPHYDAFSRSDGGRRNRSVVRPNGGRPHSLRKSQGVPSNQH